MESTFDIPRFKDAAIWERVRTALSEWSVNRCHISPLIGHSLDIEKGGVREENSQWFDELLGLDTVAIHTFSFHLANKCEVRILRGVEGGRIVGIYDRVLYQQPDAVNDYLTPARIASKLRDALDAIDERTYADYLGDAERHIAESRNQTITDLTNIQTGFFTKIGEFITEQTTKFEDKKRELELAAMEKENQLALAYDSKEQELVRQIRAVEIREEALDLRSNTDARRDLRKELKEQINQRATTSQVTQGTRLRRTWVLLGYLGLLGYFAWGTLYYSSSLQISGVPVDVLPADDPAFDRAMTAQEWAQQQTAGMHWPNIARQCAFGLAFAVTAGFFLKWLNRWAQIHSDEEFRIKRLELDIDRASWLVEMMYEWKDEKGTTMPSDLVRTLGANLFIDPVHPEHSMTAADALGSALVENASQAKLRVGENELLLKRGGIRRLAKKAIEGSEDE